MNDAFPFRPADDAAPAAWVIDRLEADVVEPSDGVSWASDTINPEPSHS